MFWLDEYERRARLIPGLLSVFPLVILFSVLGLRQVPAIVYIVGTLTIAAGGPVVVSTTVRSMGRAVEPRLWESWGGPPTTAWLRLREPSENEAQRDLWRSSIESVSGINLLSLRAERANPTKADNSIETAIKRIRDRTRNIEQFPLLYSENRGYGYERNIYGVRWAARGLALTSTAAMASYIFWITPALNRPSITTQNVFGLLACLSFVVIWFTLPSKRRVRDAANRYANELLHAAVTLREDSENQLANGDQIIVNVRQQPSSE
ncbi:hypothetical protein [Streptomyces sp. NPDC054940]